MSQKELAKGICTQSTISRIESGEVYPGIDTLVNISTRLQVPLEYFIEMLFQTNVLENEILIREIEFHLKEHNYEKVLIIVKKLSKLQSNNNVWFNLYLKYLLTTAEYYLKKITYIECINNLKEISNHSFQTTVQFRFLNIKIQNTIANIFGENGEPNTSLFYYNRILTEHIDKDYNDRKINENILTVLFNKSKTLYDMQNYKEALDTANLGIKISKESRFIILVGQFLYYKGQCLEKLNSPIDEIKTTFKQALFIFEFLQLDFYITAIKKNKYIYLDI